MLICVTGTHFVYISAIICPDPPIVPQATDNHTNCTSYGCLVTYTCDNVQVFEDGYPVKTVNCTNLGQWSEANFTCGSKFKFINQCIAVSISSQSIVLAESTN
jgi:hypothetical protein